MACALDATSCGSLAGNADFHFWTQGAACIVLDLKEERLGNECKVFISDNGGIKGLLDCSNALVRNCASPSKDMTTGSCLASAGLRDIIGDRCVDIALCQTRPWARTPKAPYKHNRIKLWHYRKLL